MSRKLPLLRIINFERLMVPVLISDNINIHWVSDYSMKAINSAQ